MKKYENYASALRSLSRASEQDLSNEFVQSGIVDKFAMQFELGWKLLKSLLAYEGDPVAASGSPRDVLKTALRYYDFLDDGDRMLRLVDTIIAEYIPEFERMQRGLEQRYGQMLND